MADQAPTYYMPTDTRHVRRENKDYEILGIKLGRGVVRKVLGICMAIVGAWVALLIVIFRVPLGDHVFLFSVPPTLMALLAIRKDRSERRAYLAWWDWVRLRARRGRPLVPPIPDTPVPGRSDFTTPRKAPKIRNRITAFRARPAFAIVASPITPESDAA